MRSSRILPAAVSVPPVIVILLAALAAAVPALAQVDTIETVTSEGAPGFWSDMKLDGDGFPHIAFQDSALNRVRYARRDAEGWTVETMDTLRAGGWYPSLALGLGGEPHVSYFAWTSAGDSIALYHAERGDSEWAVERVDIDSTTLFFSSWSSIAVGTDGEPRIAYLENAPKRRLLYATRSGDAWTVEVADSSQSSGFEADLALDGSDNPYITHLHFFDDSLEVRYSFDDGGGWTAERVAVTTEDIGWTSLDVTPGGTPAVAYLWQNDHLVYTAGRRVGGEWASVFVDSGAIGVDSRPLSVAVDGEGRTNIAYYAGGAKDLRYARYFGGTAFWLDVDTEGDAGDYNSLVMDDSGGAHISYFKRSDMELRYARVSLDLAGIAVEPADTTVTAGTSFDMRASADFGGAGLVDAAGDAEWASRNTVVATVDDKGRLAANAVGEAVIVATFDDFADSVTVTVTDVMVGLTSISVAPADTSVGQGSVFAMRATGHFGPDVTAVYTDSVTWNSRAAGVASVDVNGQVTAHSPGEAVIVAMFDQYADSATVTVEDTTSELPYYIIFNLPKEKWTLLSFPLDPANGSGTIMGTLIDTLGPPDPKKWKLGTWDTEAGNYEALESQGDRTAVGRGYWLITDDDEVFDTPTGYYPEGDYTYSLENGPGDAAGWNQVGFPHNGSMDAEEIMVTDGADTFSVTANDNILTERRVLGWINDNYAELASIGRGTGFWIRKLATGTVDLIFPIDQVVASKSEGAVAAARGVPAARKAKAPGGIEWSVSLAAAEGGRVSEKIELGVADVSGEGWSRFDFALPPKPPGDHLTLSVPRSDLGRLNGDYAAVFYPADDFLSWDLVLSGAEAPGEIALSMEGGDGAPVPPGTTFELHDGVTGDVVPFAPGETVVLAATAGERTLRLTARGPGAAGGDAASPITPLFRHAYPNPFAGETGFRFRLAAAGDVSLAIYTPSGREVRRFLSHGRGAGDHVIVWDGRDAGGRAVAPGVYFARFDFAGQSGSTRVVKLR